MTEGPWTRSMKVVHGPGPRWGSMDPWSMFCPHPISSEMNRAKSMTFIIQVAPACTYGGALLIYLKTELISIKLLK